MGLFGTTAITALLHSDSTFLIEREETKKTRIAIGVGTAEGSGLIAARLHNLLLSFLSSSSSARLFTF